ncbi:spermatogenesis-associated protein 7 isoform X3 [Pezoporus occidentalis]|uniref:spermatogenesis-associated protein 7 isoform X3 n=1 Tax=Pezoporus occidentalis TaxID=407982 RepID=UPI002F90C64F
MLLHLVKSGKLEVTTSEYRPLTIPRCGPASPFKGQLSTKSNAFCIDSSQSLTNQYLIRDHMMFHYNKILSAKAVDCSVPKSRLSSIKFADQQRREKLKKKIARCEEEMSVGKTASQTSSRESGRLLVSPFGKSFLEAEDKDGLFSCARQAQYLSRALSPYSEHGLARSSPVTYARKGSRNTSNSSVSTSSTPRKRSGLPCSCSSDSSVSISRYQRRQGSNSKARSGDLLDRHSEFFTHSRKPFTPHILISDAKSFLSGYRYYNPAQRKRKTGNQCKQHVEAQTQTDLISFPSAEKAFERKVLAEQQKSMSKAEDRRYTVHEPERRIAAFPYSFLRETPLYSQQSSARRTIEAEEEFLYLAFIEEVTNEVLSLELFSNRILEKLFECFIEENKNRLDESKMRHLLNVLKADLGCSPGSDAEHNHTGWEALDSLDLREFDTVEELEIISKSQRQGKATKNDEFFGTMDLLKEPEKCESPTFREGSKETQSKNDFSEDLTEMMDAGAVSGSYVKSEEDGDILPSCEATLNLITCASGLEANEEIGDLEESFAKALRISQDYT